MALTPRIRFQVLQRDGFACVYCGARAPRAKLHVDHIVPRSKGGSDDTENLQAACRECNTGKAARPIDGIGTDEEVADPMRAICSAGMDLFTWLEFFWHGAEPTPKEDEAVRAKMMELYFAVMDHGDLPEDHPWRPRMEEFRANVERARVEHEAEKRRGPR